MIKRLIKSISDERWNIGFIQNDFESVLIRIGGLQILLFWMSMMMKYTSWWKNIINQFIAVVYRGL